MIAQIGKWVKEAENDLEKARHLFLKAYLSLVFLFIMGSIFLPVIEPEFFNNSDVYLLQMLPYFFVLGAAYYVFFINNNHFLIHGFLGLLGFFVGVLLLLVTGQFSLVVENMSL